MGVEFTGAMQARLEECITEDDIDFRAAMEKKMSTANAAMGKKGGSSKIDKQRQRQQKKDLKNAVGPLLESARKAYTAYIRGYSAKERAVRHMFTTRALHLGHVARSFALKEVPTSLAKANINQRRGNKDMNNEEEENGDILKSTGKKRSSRLAFGSKGKKQRGGEGEEADDGNEEVEDSSVIQGKKSRSGRNTKMPKKGSSRHDDDNVGGGGEDFSSRTVMSFLDSKENNPFDGWKGQDVNTKESTFKNTRAKMHANALRLQDMSMDNM